MVSVSGRQVSHKRTRRIIGIFAKRIAIPRIRKEWMTSRSNLLHEEFSEQILSFFFGQDFLLHERHDQVAQDDILQCLRCLGWGCFGRLLRGRVLRGNGVAADFLQPSLEKPNLLWLSGYESKAHAHSNEGINDPRLGLERFILP